ncbi:hypothetical protein GUJ93_ZPchr0007g6215 [Zizania palustris]|uniref:Uncharacterized protein n=1 Tax=Zizania palustris TaxID=103762 RepID=A0A8J5T9U6_ZIZPA|nr:hypothetical protein GUJ93_ZPchr0007g6215 [Zizania palustris]
MGPARKDKTSLSDKELRRSLRLKIKSLGFKKTASSAKAGPSLQAFPAIEDFINISRSNSTLPSLSIQQIQHFACFLCGIPASKVTPAFLLASDSDDPGSVPVDGVAPGASVSPRPSQVTQATDLE